MRGGPAAGALVTMDDSKRKLHLWGRLLVVGVALLAIGGAVGIAAKVRAKHNDRADDAAKVDDKAGEGKHVKDLPTRRAAPRKHERRPNIVMIMTDDQPGSTVRPRVMPNLHRLLMERGTSFSDYVVATPLCCPSRAVTITGEYGHNNGVLKNNYKHLLRKRNVLPAWLQKAGYRTAHIGKWLNGYEDYVSPETQPAPGWDLWFTQLKPRQYYDWTASLNGRLMRYGTDDDDHLIDVVNQRAKRWTRRLARGSRPFYMQLDYYAPHIAPGRDNSCGPMGPIPAPREEGRFMNTKLPRPPNFNEADVSDKPKSIADLPVGTLPLMGKKAIAKDTLRYRCTLGVMHSVDRGIKQVYNAVKRAGELDRTVFIFTTDNGYFYGEHRIPGGKKIPYEEDIHLPLTIKVPPGVRDRAPVVRSRDESVANIDLAPTILDLAQAKPCVAKKKHPCRTMDGRSMMPLLDGRAGTWPGSRPISIEFRDCAYRGVRVKGETYFEYGEQRKNGSCKLDDAEHYDLKRDPYQLQNLYPAKPGSPEARRQRRLKRKLNKISVCAGIRGRDKRPRSGHFCR